MTRAKGKSRTRPRAITSLQSSPTRGRRNWIIYADSGVGKSVIAASAPNGLVLCSEIGALEGARELGYDPDEWVVDSYDKFAEAYEWLADGGAREYDWVSVDSITETEEIIWKDELDSNYAMNPRRSPFNPALQDYPTVWNRTKEIINLFNRLPVSVLYTATAMRISAEDEENEETITKLMPMIGSPNRGDLSQKFCAKATLVGLLRTRKGKKGKLTRRLYLEANKRWIAKSRHPSLGRFVDNPSIDEMVSIIDGAKTEKVRRKKAS